MPALVHTQIDVTVARALVESDGRVLLVRRAAWDSQPGRWELPGGKIDAGERLHIGLAREVEEETGLMLAGAQHVGARDMISPSGRRVREHVFRASAVGPVLLSDEHDAHVWVTSPGDLELTEAAALSLAS